MSMAIDEGPLDTMPNMSPSCTSSFENRLNRSRTRPVLWNCRCKSSTKKRKMRPETSLRGRVRGRMIPSGGGGGGGASTLLTRPPVTTVIDVMSCFTPSSKISNSSFVRSGTKLPLSSRTTTSFVTRSTCSRNVGFSCGGGAGWVGAGVCADSPAVRTTRHAVDQKPLFFKFICGKLYIAARSLSRSSQQGRGRDGRRQAGEKNRVIRRVPRHSGLTRQSWREPSDSPAIRAAERAPGPTSPLRTRDRTRGPTAIQVPTPTRGRTAGQTRGRTAGRTATAARLCDGLAVGGDGDDLRPERRDARDWPRVDCL